METSVAPVRVLVRASTLLRFDAVAADAASESALSRAASLLRAGALVAFPTETVYGLGADAGSSAAARGIFAAKGRPADNPLIVHVASVAMLHRVAHVPEAAAAVMERFWPGPLTLLLPQRAGAVAPEVTCGLPTVAVRMPAHPVARLLIERADVPVAAPSANRSGRPSPTTAAHVLRDLQGRVPLILDGGPADVGVESTVLDLLSDPPALLRPGGVTFEQLRELLPNLRVYRKHFVDAALEAHPTTPGMKYRHYSPDAHVVLFDVDSGADATDNSTSASQPRDRDAALHAAVAAEIASLQAAPTPASFAVVRTRPHAYAGLVPWTDAETARSVAPPLGIDYALGDVARPEDIARGLFAALRDLEAAQVRTILVEGIADSHEGLAVMNRLRKAASQVRPV